MNLFSSSLLGSPALASAAAGVLSWLATYLLHSTILLGLAWAVSRQLRSRHPLGEQAIWRAALFGSILTATLQIATGWQPLGGALSFPVVPTQASVPGAVSTEPGLEADAPVTTLSLRAATLATDAPLPEALGSLAEQTTLSPIAPSSPAPWTWLALAWSLGAAALLVRWSAAHAALSRRLRPRLEVIDGTLFRTLRRLRAEAGFDSAVRLTCAHRLSVPIALGFSHPEICLPPRALSHLDEREAESLLAHELAHLARRDPAALNLTQVAASLFFFQPLVWLARRKLYDLSELLADDWAIGRTGRPLSLARCLAEVACWSVHERRLPVPSMAESSSPLGLRIRRLLGEIRPSRRLPIWALPACGLVLVAFAAVAPAVSARAKDEPKGTPVASQEEAAKAEADRDRGDRNDLDDRGDRDEYRRPQPPETYVHESPRGDEIPPVFSEDEELELGEHAEELAAQLADMGKGWDSEEFGREMAKFGHDFKMSAEERAKLAGEIDALVARTVPDREALERLTAQAARLADRNLSAQDRERIAAEIRRAAEDMRPSEAEIAEIQRRARQMAPSAEEARRMAEDARRFAAAHRPSEEEMRKIREQSRKYEQEVRRIVEQHRGEIEKVQREMQQKLEEMQERLQEDIERSLGGDEQGLRDQARRGNHPPRVPRTPRPPRPAVAPVPGTPVAPGLPPRVALAPLPPGMPAPHSLPTPRVAPTPGVPAAPPAPRAAPVVAPARPGRPAPAPRALPAPAPEAPEVVEPPEPGEPAEAPEAAEAPEPPPVHVR